MATTVGVLAIQGAFIEHLTLLRKASVDPSLRHTTFSFVEVRTSLQLSTCDALIIPGGESTAISLVAARTDLLDALRDFVKVDRRPTWGTCAGLILLAEAANSTKKGGQELIGGLDVRVNRNHFGRQIESFQADLTLSFLTDADLPSFPYPGVFIRAPVVERLLPHATGIQTAEVDRPDSIVAPSKQAKDTAKVSSQVDIMAVLPGRLARAADHGAVVDATEAAGDVVAVRQGNVFGTSFHPELTADARIHIWWLQQVVLATALDKQ